MGQCTLKNVNNYLNTNIYSYFETSGGQSSNFSLNVVHFSTPELIRHLWQLKTIVFLHWCLIWAVFYSFCVVIFKIGIFQFLRNAIDCEFFLEDKQSKHTLNRTVLTQSTLKSKSEADK
jgi:hypothetical protein